MRAPGLLLGVLLLAGCGAPGPAPAPLDAETVAAPTPPPTRAVDPPPAGPRPDPTPARVVDVPTRQIVGYEPPAPPPPPVVATPNLAVVAPRAAGERRVLDLGGGVLLAQRWCPPGTFIMGASPDVANPLEWDGPPTPVTLSTGFWMGETEVTIDQFRRFVESTGYRTDAETLHPGWAWDGHWLANRLVDWRQPAQPVTSLHPAVVISHRDAVAFCQWASTATGTTVTLPTEAQWEYACRADTRLAYHFGSDPAALADHAIFDVDSTKPGDEALAPVATRRANPWGLHDMHGNAWEWTASRWQYQHPGAPVVDPAGGPADSIYFVYRGGGWRQGPESLRAERRLRMLPQLFTNQVGFRVLSPD